ncbi:MAG TPA: tetratricopeptide repeat protein [Pirellulales bacterium]|jgi:tetratricopeptide (TPR) repeat protein|nr:tetratricopeptide repeat protein [Pirellulales bacterium]
MSRPRKPGRVLIALSIAMVAGVFSLALWWWQRPAERLRRGMATLESRDWERLEYEQFSLPKTSVYLAPSSLFSAALKLERREFTAALRDLRYAAGDPAIQPLAWVMAGKALYAQDRFREAEMNFKHALELAPDLVEAHRWLAIAYYDIGLMNEAQHHLQRVSELEPSDPRPHRIMAVIHMDHGSYAVAVEDFEESLRRDPHQTDEQDILTELAQTQFVLKRYEDARRTLSGCQETAEVLAMQSDACFALGDPLQAKVLAQKALRSEPDQRLAFLVLGRVALEERRHDEAVDLLSKGAAAAPSDYDLQYTLLTALRAANRPEEAERQVAVVEELRELRDRFDSLAEKAVDEPYNAEVRYELGMLATRLEMPRIAESWLKAAVALNPNHPLARSELKRRDPASLNAAALLRGS